MPGSRAREIVRRSLGALTVTALLGAAVAVAAGLSWPGPVRATDAVPASGVPSRTVVPTRTISPSRTTSPSHTPSPTPKTSPIPKPSPTPTQSSSGHVGVPGIALTARPDPDGSFFVSEVITLPEAVTEVAVRPASIGDAGIGFERLRPAATNVEVTAGGQALVVPDGPITSEVTLHWASPTKQVQLRYRLSQVSIASAHAKPGRALAAFGSLLGRMPADLPVTVVVTGKTVLSLTCPQLPLATMTCGAGKAPQFRTLQPIPFDRSRVLVQYDRPARR
ncbi:MAG TPA: hypothetical protein VN609_04855 [Propionibacteriaceae bacterium]|nr:hypothetical protein [Propionibacteriaceae bacterium]